MPAAADRQIGSVGLTCLERRQMGSLAATEKGALLWSMPGGPWGRGLQRVGRQRGGSLDTEEFFTVPPQRNESAMAMSKQLWSINALATEFGRDRRTISRALDEVPPDGTISGHKSLVHGYGIEGIARPRQAVFVHASHRGWRTAVYHPRPADELARDPRRGSGNVAYRRRSRSDRRACREGPGMAPGRVPLFWQTRELAERRRFPARSRPRR